MKRFSIAAYAIVLSFSIAQPRPAAADQAPTPQQRDEMARMYALARSIHPQTGVVSIGGANATLNLGQGYYFLDAADAKRVLTEAWGNPPSAVDEVLGLVLPAGKTFLDDTWGAVVTYQPTGYVSDSDARTADYNKIMSDLQSGEDDSNKERSKQGFATEHLVGWATPPIYDKSSHSVIWARDIQFGNQNIDTLNYDVRLLGRTGVLSLNMISTMNKLPEIRSAADNLRQVADFNTGARYADFSEGVDKKAGYGLAGLVAAGVGVAAAKKFGLLALLALFGKKLIVLVVALFAGLAARIRKLFGMRQKDSAEG